MLKLYDTKTRQVTEVKPLEPGVVKMYTCGPTVYRDAHIGNYRSYLMADWIRRALEYQGIQVTAIKNITDVGHMRQEALEQGDDKVIAAALAEGKTPQEIAQFYTDRFLADEAKLNIEPANTFPKATEHVDEMIEIIERLIQRGHAYEIDGNVYYSVSSFPTYGGLSGNIQDGELREGVRVEADPLKRDPRDFTLWKAAEPGRELKWPSPWSEGFPGWHIECSAMSIKYLGEHFDIHTGGVDNVFPHHEGEIAQSEGFTGRPVVETWVHGQHLLADGVKMAKSTGNSFVLGDIEERGIDPRALRYLCLTAKYNTRLNFTFAALRAADRALRRLQNILWGLHEAPAEVPEPVRLPETSAVGDAAAVVEEPFEDSDEVTETDGGPAGDGPPDGDTAEMPPDAGAAEAEPDVEEPRDVEELKQEWLAKLLERVNDNLDMPGALALTWKIFRSDVPAQTKYEIVLEFDKVLGLGLKAAMEANKASPEVTSLVRQRASHRSGGEFEEADQLRDQLVSEGYIVEDTLSAGRAASAAGVGTRVRLRTDWEEYEKTVATVSSSAEVESFLEQDDDVDFTIGIVASNYADDVSRCLQSALWWGRDVSVEVVVVDNGSTDETASWLAEAAAKDDRVRVMHTDHVLGDAAARNIVLKQSRGKTVILFDTSVEVRGDIFAAIDAALEDETVGVTGPFGLRTDDLHHFHEGEGEAGDMDAMQSYLFAFRRSRLRDVGLMRESFRFYRNLDIDYSFHFKDKGLRIVADPSLPVRRHEHRAWSDLPENDRDELSRKNYGRFLHKWGDRVDLLVSLQAALEPVE